MRKSKWLFIVMGCLLAAGILFVPGTKEGLRAEKAEKEVTITVIWHGGVCADALLEIAKDFTAMTGIKVVGTFVGYGPAWHDKVAAEFAAKGSGFDLACWDSQSISEFAGGGHTVLLNPYIEKSDVLKMSDWTPEMLKRYGEYPEGSGDIYALPINADCEGMHYRKDLFEDPEEKAFERLDVTLELVAVFAVCKNNPGQEGPERRAQPHLGHEKGDPDHQEQGCGGNDHKIEGSDRAAYAFESVERSSDQHQHKG